jgi:two-component system phosphoglycerate transport system response regulator PgtA
METIRNRVVVVSHDDQNRAALRRIFGDNGWKIRERRAVSEFRHYLKPQWSGVILTECCLPDGTWRDILTLANAVCPDAKVVVTSRLADEHLWAEVLSRGAFDLLAQPLDQTEVLRVGTSAWQHSQPRVRKATA